MTASKNEIMGSGILKYWKLQMEKNHEVFHFVKLTYVHVEHKDVLAPRLQLNDAVPAPQHCQKLR
jgi:hypothetical protein